MIKVKLVYYFTENNITGKPIKKLLPLKPSVPVSHADVDDLLNDFNYKPNTTFHEGINKFIKWHLDFIR